MGRDRCSKSGVPLPSPDGRQGDAKAKMEIKRGTELKKDSDLRGQKEIWRETSRDEIETRQEERHLQGFSLRQRLRETESELDREKNTQKQG